ncbi:MAG TPA: glycosyl transferase family 90 [Candidatus Sulfotelmatobacter sp.]|jgi:hypothetical protein|nr:glycosyl transferase family 90 [Candidatus Sulfotelmatobacter sp.]
MPGTNQKFLEAAKTLQMQGIQMLQGGRTMDAIPVFEMAFASAFMAGQPGFPMTVRLLPTAALPLNLAVAEHVFIHVCKNAITITAGLDLIASPICELSRFPQIGGLFADVAAHLPDDRHYGCVMDLGDGCDKGPYRRIAYSSARPDTVLIPDPFFFLHDNYGRLRDYVLQQGKPWRQRQDKLFWRGSASGHQTGGDDAGWGWHPRVEVCHRAQVSPLAERLDIALVSLHQIAEEPLRQKITEAGLTRLGVSPNHFAEYRYLLDMDGWTNAWSLLHKLIMGAAIVKIASPGGFRQWYYDRLVPWRNYVPIAADLSDFDAVTEWIFTHPAECETIAAEGAALGEAIQLEPETDAAAKAIMPLLAPL